MSSAATLRRAGVFSRLWSAYVVALKERPLRTKMMTGGVTTLLADLIAQVGIEKKALFRDDAGIKGDGVVRERFDIVRTIRLTFYGGVLFAPLAHTWLGILHRVQLASPITTLAARLSLDFTIWSPFVAIWFTTMISLLEGKNKDEILHKLDLQFLPMWGRAICVFGPAQVVNLTLVPPHHRNFVLQSVGLCWNVYMSWTNNKNNQKIDHIAVSVSTTETTGP